MANIALILGIAVVLIAIILIIYFVVIKKKADADIDVGGICTGNSDCKNGACGVEKGKLICCPSGNVVTIDGENYCSNLIDGNSCLDDVLCRSGYCKGVTETKEGVCSPIPPIPPQPECSSTIQCQDPTKRCVNGVCVPIVPVPECSSTVPCIDSTKICVDGVCVPNPLDPNKPCSITNPIGRCFGSDICNESGECVSEDVLFSGNNLYSGHYIKSQNGRFILRQNPDTKLCVYEIVNGKLIQKSCRGTSRGNALGGCWVEMKSTGDLCGYYATESGGKAIDTGCYYRNLDKTAGAFFVTVENTGKVSIYNGVSGDISRSKFIYDLGF